MAIETKTKKWGNSIGVVIPAETVERLKLKPGEQITIDVEKKQNVLKELFGSLRFTRSTKMILEEVREELEGKWLRGNGVSIHTH